MGLGEEVINNQQEKGKSKLFPFFFFNKISNENMIK